MVASVESRLGRDRVTIANEVERKARLIDAGGLDLPWRDESLVVLQPYALLFRTSLHSTETSRQLCIAGCVGSALVTGIL